MKRGRQWFAVIVLLGLTACGQTGALYLPDEPGNVVIREPATSTGSTPAAPTPPVTPPPQSR